MISNVNRIKMYCRGRNALNANPMAFIGFDSSVVVRPELFTDISELSKLESHHQEKETWDI